MIYLAHPYATPHASERSERVKVAADVFRSLVKQGHSPFLPTMAHHIDDSESLGREFWLKWSAQCLARTATSLLILPFKGWRESQGLMGEIMLARIMRLPIFSPGHFDLPTPEIADPRAWYGGPAFEDFIKNIRQG